MDDVNIAKVMCGSVGCDFAGFIEFGPEIAGSDQKTKLLLSSEDLVCMCVREFIHCT